MDDPHEISKTYSGQFMNICEKYNASCILISSNIHKKKIEEARYIIEHRPNPWISKTGIKYYLGQFLYGIRFVYDAIKEKSDIVVVSLETVPFYLLMILKILGKKNVVSIHGMLWAPFKPISIAKRMFLSLDKLFYKYGAYAVMVASKDIGDQVRKLADNENLPILEFMPTYQESDFQDIAQPNFDSFQKTFNILYAGRVVEDKGIFDLVKIAKKLKNSDENFHFIVCGDGADIDRLKSDIDANDLHDMFTLNGHCEREKLKEVISKSAVQIVPTTSDCAEGFAMVVAEGVLSHRPVLASKVCPAVRYFNKSIVEVEPGDIDAYVKTLIELRRNRTLYENMINESNHEAALFYSYNASWEAMLSQIIDASLNDSVPKSVTWVENE